MTTLPVFILVGTMLLLFGYLLAMLLRPQWFWEL